MSTNTTSTTIVLTNVQARAVLAALVALDGAPKIAQLGNGNQQVVNKPYKLSGKVRMLIGRNIAALNEVQTALDKSRDGLIKELSGGADTLSPENKEAWAEFTKRFNELVNESNEYPTIKLVKATSLNLDENEIPQSVLAGLTPVLDDDMLVD